MGMEAPPRWFVLRCSTSKSHPFRPPRPLGDKAALESLMSEEKPTTIDVICSCCGAHLAVDAELGKVIAHTPPPKAKPERDLDHVAQLLEKDAARRETLFKQSAEDEKIKSQLLDRKFAEALKKTKDQPVTPLLRDIDLD